MSKLSVEHIEKYALSIIFVLSLIWRYTSKNADTGSLFDQIFIYALGIFIFSITTLKIHQIGLVILDVIIILIQCLYIWLPLFYATQAIYPFVFLWLIVPGFEYATNVLNRPRRMIVSDYTVDFYSTFFLLQIRD